MSLRETFKEINILTMESQYIYECLVYVQKNITEFAKNSDRHEFDTRFKNKLAIPRFRLQKANASFMGQGVRLYNKIPDDIMSLALNKFKSSIKRTLLKKACYRVGEFVDDDHAWT